MRTYRLGEGATSLAERLNVLRTPYRILPKQAGGPEGVYVKRCYCARYRFGKWDALMLSVPTHWGSAVFNPFNAEATFV